MRHGLRSLTGQTLPPGPTCSRWREDRARWHSVSDPRARPVRPRPPRPDSSPQQALASSLHLDGEEQDPGRPLVPHRTTQPGLRGPDPPERAAILGGACDRLQATSATGADAEDLVPRPQRGRLCVRDPEPEEGRAHPVVLDRGGACQKALRGDGKRGRAALRGLVWIRGSFSCGKGFGRLTPSLTRTWKEPLSARAALRRSLCGSLYQPGHDVWSRCTTKGLAEALGACGRAQLSARLESMRQALKISWVLSQRDAIGADGSHYIHAKMHLLAAKSPYLRRCPVSLRASGKSALLLCI